MSAKKPQQQSIWTALSHQQRRAAVTAAAEAAVDKVPLKRTSLVASAPPLADGAGAVARKKRRTAADDDRSNSDDIAFDAGTVTDGEFLSSSQEDADTHAFLSQAMTTTASDTHTHATASDRKRKSKSESTSSCWGVNDDTMAELESLQFGQHLVTPEKAVVRKDVGGVLPRTAQLLHDKKVRVSE